eukprot:TRINITY_DN739_c0_g1_i1.p1 TRINITY_DN739_c0_g1~~TRINITY_DN739_c0_g1_i1.p1  ORF type:complete len:153 (+),score=36.93 TRINITY_DN739_c0_g1_i1:104-562(+)
MSLSAIRTTRTLLRTQPASSLLRLARFTRFNYVQRSSFSYLLLKPTPLQRYPLTRPTPILSRAFGAAAAHPTPEQVGQRVVEVVKRFEKVNPAAVNPNAHFINDLGLDSLDCVELVMAFEDEFAIEIPDAEAEKIVSIPDAVTYLSTNPNIK